MATDYVCPKCENELEKFKAKSGKYWWRCTGPKDFCDSLFADQNGKPKLTKPSREPAPDEIRCPDCEDKMVFVSGAQFGDFFACAQYPDCRGSRDMIPGSEPPEPAPECSKCGKPTKVRSGKKGSFLGCSAYPECSQTAELSASA